MPNVDCVRIRKQLSQYPESKLGFVIYRLTYKDDAQWARFMEHLNTRVRLNLEADGEEDLFEHIDWDIQEDPKLQDAEDDEVRRLFKKYLQDNGDNVKGPRDLACVAVSQNNVDRVLKKGPKPQKFDALGMGYVDLLSIDAEEGYQSVGLSFLFPRVYSLLDGIGWHHINVGNEEVFAT